MESARNRPERYGVARSPRSETPEGASFARLSQLVHAGIEPSDVARRLISAIQNDELYVFTHPERRPEVEAKFSAILAAFDRVPVQ
jgi:hypothetical protein